ncbi:unnamed protein product [Darwinula stevensoni]|uniref:Amine oxidase domain-containing protein n=1 Tax=Darwinula stevensoni TaxID=69355 RepID=A0A7R8XA54_9CRUS|nr:unnamed protein product [Darwinula stevensoni]CAG0891097.1 unnamed protein product [Darwinula stevensoni]
MWHRSFLSALWVMWSLSAGDADGTDAPGRRNFKVVIVGGGLAGLSAAEHLARNGIGNVVVLEATDRAGGRVQTDTRTFGGEKVEMGATFVHGGSLNNPIYHLANRLQLFSSPPKRVTQEQWVQSDKFLAFDARYIDEDVVGNATRLFAEALEKMDEDNPVPVVRHLNRFLRDAHSDSESDSRDFQLVWNALKNLEQLDVGAELEKASTMEFTSYQELTGGDMTTAKPMSDIIRYLVSLHFPDMFKLGEPVAKIGWDGGSHRAVVETEAGKRYDADHVIVTVSLGVLKNGTDLFQPQLPNEKLQAIERLGFGTVNKIFLEFEKPFWSADDHHIVLCQNASAPSDDWIHHVSSLDMEHHGKKPLMTLWLAGDAAIRMETEPDDVVKDKCTRLLREFTGNPSLDPPKLLHRTKWMSNPRFRGSYSYVSTQSMREDALTLGEPLPSAQDPILLFAGEATHPQFFSTMHGAFLSGIREAERVVALHRLKGSM